MDNFLLYARRAVFTPLEIPIRGPGWQKYNPGNWLSLRGETRSVKILYLKM